MIHLKRLFAGALIFIQIGAVLFMVTEIVEFFFPTLSGLLTISVSIVGILLGYSMYLVGEHYLEDR